MSIVDTGTLHHTCFIVADVEKVARQLSTTLGIKPWGIWTIKPKACTVHGKETVMTFRVAIAPVGKANLELVQPVSGASVYAEHLQERGSGFHHTCIAYPDRKSMLEAKKQLLAQDRKLIQDASLGDLGEFCYFELDEIGSCLELLYLGALPRPEITIE